MRLKTTLRTILDTMTATLHSLLITRSIYPQCSGSFEIFWSRKEGPKNEFFFFLSFGSNWILLYF